MIPTHTFILNEVVRYIRKQYYLLLILFILFILKKFNLVTIIFPGIRFKFLQITEFWPVEEDTNNLFSYFQQNASFLTKLLS